VLTIPCDLDLDGHWIVQTNFYIGELRNSTFCALVFVFSI
jgi:hypothetical protein